MPNKMGYCAHSECPHANKLVTLIARLLCGTCYFREQRLGTLDKNFPKLAKMNEATKFRILREAPERARPELEERFGIHLNEPSMITKTENTAPEQPQCRHAYVPDNETLKARMAELNALDIEALFESEEAEQIKRFTHRGIRPGIYATITTNGAVTLSPDLTQLVLDVLPTDIEEVCFVDIKIMRGNVLLKFEQRAEQDSYPVRIHDTKSGSRFLFSCKAIANKLALKEATGCAASVQGRAVILAPFN